MTARYMERRAAGPRFLGLAGMVAPLVFVLGVSIAAQLHTGYDDLGQLVDELVLGPYGQIQTGTYVLFGLLLAAFASGLKKEMSAARMRTLTPTLIMVAGVGSIGTGLFPCDPGCPQSAGTLTGLLHLVSSHAWALGLIGAALAASVEFKVDRRPRPSTVYSLVTGIAGAALYLLFLWSMSSDRLSGWEGTMQRLWMVVMLPWVEITAMRFTGNYSITVGARTPTPASAGKPSA